MASLVASIRLLAIDIDGTLLDSCGQIPDAHRLALAEATDRDIELVLVTGRAFHFARPVAEELRLPVTLIVNNGAAVKHVSGRTVARRVLPREVAFQVLQSAAGFENSVAVVFDREPGTAEARQIVFEHMDWSHPRREGYYKKNRAFIHRVSPLEAALVEDPLQVMFNGSVEAMRVLFQQLACLPAAARLSLAATEYESRDFSLVDVNGEGCTKGLTLARWAQEQGYSSEEVMAVGDNLNDLDMLRFAGTSVIMGNATAHLKAMGFHVTAGHDEGGLADAIRRFALTD